MSALPDFLMSIAKLKVPPGEQAGKMSIIINRPYVHLEKELRTTFDGEKNVQIIVDRRYGERRKDDQQVPVERRRTDRRQGKEKLVDVIISL